MTPQPDRCLRNDDGRFVDATAQFGFDEAPASFGFQPIFTDVDDDGDLDLYITNDSRSNGLFLNEGGRFVEDGLVAGVAVGRSGNAEAGMGVAGDDLTGDVLPELLVTNFSTQFNSLYVNQSAPGNPWFDELSEASGVGRPSWFLLSWGCHIFDADQDGLLDAVVSNGHVYPQVDGCEPAEVVYRQANSFFRGLPGPGPRFTDLGAAAGVPFAWPASHRGSVAADLDGDGALDLVFNRLDEAPLLAFNASPARGAFLLLTLEEPGNHGGESRPVLAVGARASVTAGGRTLTRELRRGSSFLSSEDPRLHFGLGSAERVDSLTVRWPDGITETLNDLPVNTWIAVRRGSPSTVSARELLP